MVLTFLVKAGFAVAALLLLSDNWGLRDSKLVIKYWPFHYCEFCIAFWLNFAIMVQGAFLQYDNWFSVICVAVFNSFAATAISILIYKLINASN